MRNMKVNLGKIRIKESVFLYLPCQVIKETETTWQIDTYKVNIPCEFIVSQ